MRYKSKRYAEKVTPKTVNRRDKIDEPTTTLERISTAMSSDDLTLREHGCDLNVIIAMGFVGQSSGRMASALLRLAFDDDLTAVKEARTLVIKEAKAFNARWRIAAFRDLVRVADTAIAYYLWPTCPKCEGRKYQLVPGTPHLSDRECTKCHGTGRRPLPPMHRREVAELMTRMSDIESIAEAAVRKRLRTHE